MNRSLALLLAALFTLAPISHAIAQETRTYKLAPKGASGGTLVISGSEFFILDAPPPKERNERPQKKLPIVVVVVFWIIAMFLWQLYFNYKHKK